MEMDAFSLLEKDLRMILAPVQPNPEFVQKLEHRLTRTDKVALEEDRGMSGWLIAVLGIAAGVLLIGLVRLILRALKSR